MEKKELELYLHIPFCVQKCAYCDFLSGPATPCVQAAYVEALCREIKEAGQTAGAYEVSTVFIGGGTPSVLLPKQMQRIMETLRSSFLVRADAEVTIEANPGTVDEEKLLLYRHLGINRLSFGLQSAEDFELKLLGRIHTFRQFLDSYALARTAGFDNISVDLISAIPGQTKESFSAGLKKVADLSPEHISVYSLILEEGTPFYEWYVNGRGEKKLPPLPTEEDERWMYEQTEVVLKEAGYHRYEVSNYAKEGRECRHNIGYWRRKEYLGLGTGSASLINEERFSNIRDQKIYIERMLDQAEEEPLWNIRRERETLSVKDQIEETMMLGLRMEEGVCLETFEEQFHVPLQEIYKEPLDKYVRLGLLRICREGSRLYVRLSKEGISVSNIILADFFFA